MIVNSATLLAAAAGAGVVLWADAPVRRLRYDPRVLPGTWAAAVLVGLLLAALVGFAQ